jgi:type 1 glutamine amidotransferase
MSGNLTELIAQVEAFDVIDSVDFVSLTEFAGYDPEVIFRAVMKLISTRDDQILLQMIIFFGHLRGFGGGKTWAKLIERTASKEGKELLNKAQQKFSIVMDKSKLTNITIDRIMGAFSAVTYKAWQKLVKDGKGNSKLPSYTGNLPVQYRYPGSPAAMTKADWAAHKENYIEWSVQIQTLWKVPKIDKDDIAKFAELQYNNSLYPMASREKR